MLIAASGVKITGPTGEGEPILTENIISLNGEEMCEDFFLCDDAGAWKGFCKTARKDYDDVVTAILIRATQLLGPEYMNGEISSDGNWAEWSEGRRLVKLVFPGEQFVCPWAQD